MRCFCDAGLSRGLAHSRDMFSRTYSKPRGKAPFQRDKPLPQTHGRPGRLVSVEAPLRKNELIARETMAAGFTLLREERGSEDAHGSDLFLRFGPLIDRIVLVGSKGAERPVRPISVGFSRRLRAARKIFHWLSTK
jgi:hypothetical protein